MGTGGFLEGIPEEGGNEEVVDEWSICAVESAVAGGSGGISKPKGHKMKLKFQVADVSKPLIAVKRIVEQGNHVNFGPGENDNFIENRDSGHRLKLRQNGRGSYLMDVHFSGGESTSITVDSGAEESVCPWAWGSQFPVVEPDRWMSFAHASGGSIEHYGAREVVVSSPF